MKLLQVLIWFFLYHAVITLLGFLFARFRFTHKFGLRLMAMGFRYNLLPKYCKLPCATTECGNWTCPNYHNRGGDVSGCDH